MAAAVFMLLLHGCASIDEENKMQEKVENATFAGGCFWCMEAIFQETEGVTEVISGYMGGEKKVPTYEEVSSGTTGHYEVIMVVYDPERISYAELLDLFWRNINPTDRGGQFVNRGPQYRTAIFYHDEKQKKLAEQSKAELHKIFENPIATEILPVQEFYRAEDYHQDYFLKNKLEYLAYKSGSGREEALSNIWENREDLQERLTTLQYEVTQNCQTEPPFQNEYWNETRDGIYVDIVSGEVLFSSEDKFKSGTGWPSFKKPLEEENIVEKKEGLLGRTEVRSRKADSHLGHVFNDGPEPTGLRYCINSASLRFIPKGKLEEEGYSEYLRIFEDR